MPTDFAGFNTDLQALCDKYQVHVTGKATPVASDEDDFDLTVQAVVPASTDASSEAAA